MSSSAEFPRGIPIPTDEIRSALESVAVPGYTGVIQLSFSLTAAAADCVLIEVVRRQVSKVGQSPTGHQPATHQRLPDPTRKKPVESAIEEIRGKLIIRPVLTALEVQIVDGILQKKTIQE